MHTLICCALSAIGGIVIGILITVEWTRSMRNQAVAMMHDHGPAEPCFPPQLTIIEGIKKTGTDQS